MNIVRHTDEVLEFYESAQSSIITLWIFVVLGPLLSISVLLVSTSIMGIFLGVLLMSLIFLLFTTSIPDTCTIDKRAQKIYFRKRGMIRSKVQEYWLHEIIDLDVQVGSSSIVSMVFLFTSGGKEKFDSSKDREEVKNIAIHVLTFLGLPVATGP